MSDYRMDIRGSIGLSEYSNIYDYLCIVDKEDKFTISIDKENKDSVGTISSMLQDNRFIVDNQWMDNEGNYVINAHKND
ncbi:hypothetical protein K5V21_17935 [Clostridium sardiniense]|uniref:Uncharacterized protein n=1 Tax=Clostridium sardiniense TaxID=29369 RepID=A0ABS7L2K6_CLOSR|nr:hypothetical protein [Clostridium sardiniense]MBM7836274.1 hypothetical protein [Clostridium sardiniense]MBY0757313.1 hypothetical protein [Clostridium sardiniense]MDQ0461725.1 hypothetical protein [Clostridium sardiniense]